MTVPEVTLDVAVEALDTVIALGPGRVDDTHVVHATALRATVDERLALGDGLTVVAVAGGTGVGKSSLVNRLVGASVAAEGVRRPTTSRPLAIVGPGEPAGALLDWLAIDDRIEAPDGFPAGLVLVDLPDHDSVVDSHRRTSDRLARRVDGLVVVVDPVKYARADLHDGPLAALRATADLVTVVLNRTDELPADDLARCLADLAGQLDDAHADPPPILTTSAATGEGIAELRDRIAELVVARTAAQRRLVADAAVLADRVARDLVELPDPVPDVEVVTDALLDATDAHRVVAEAQLAYRRDARQGIRSPLVRAALLPVRGVSGVARAFGLGERSPDPATTTTRASAGRIERVLADELRLHDATGATHAALGATLEELAARGAPALADAVNGVGTRPAPRRWWRVGAAVTGVLELVALVGFVWLVLLGVGEWLQLPPIPVPRITEAFSWPTVSLLAGVVARLLAGIVLRAATRRGARRHGRDVSRRIRTRLARAADERLLAPYADERARHTRLREAISTLRGGPP